MDRISHSCLWYCVLQLLKVRTKEAVFSPIPTLAYLLSPLDLQSSSIKNPLLLLYLVTTPFASHIDLYGLQRLYLGYPVMSPRLPPLPNNCFSSPMLRSTPKYIFPTQMSYKLVLTALLILLAAPASSTISSPVRESDCNFISCGFGSIPLTEYCKDNGVHVSSPIGDLNLGKVPGICATCLCSKQPPARTDDGGLDSWVQYQEGHPGLGSLIREADTCRLGSDRKAVSEDGETHDDGCQRSVQVLQAQSKRKYISIDV